MATQSTQSSLGSTSVEQGSVISSVSHRSTSRAHSTTTARGNLDAFVKDPALDVGSRGGDSLGTAERQQSRARRVEGLLTSVDEHLQVVRAGANGDGNKHSGGQTQQPGTADKAGNFLGIGAQFNGQSQDGPQ